MWNNAVQQRVTECGDVQNSVAHSEVLHVSCGCLWEQRLWLGDEAMQSLQELLVGLDLFFQPHPWPIGTPYALNCAQAVK